MSVLVEGSSSIHNNHNLLTIINDMMGKEVLVEACDGNKYLGLFVACSPELDIGLRYAFEVTEQNEKNLLPRKEDVIEKLQFKYSDIVVLSSLMSDEKVVKNFATDREYHMKQNGIPSLDEELTAWDGDEEGIEIGAIEQTNTVTAERQRNNRNGGWSADDMFSANTKLGVESTFDEGLSQYTTADIEGTEEDRKKADRIAREIENSAQTKFYNRLENDDDERDLDKVTSDVDDYEIPNKKGQRGGGNNNNYNNGRVGGGGGRGGGPATNRRAEGLKGGNINNDRRGSGPPNQSSGLGGRYGNQAAGGGSGGYQGGNKQPHPQGQYIPGQTKYDKQRPTGQEVQDSYNEFAKEQTTSLPRKELPGKVFENTNFKAQKVLLEPANRPALSPRGPAPSDQKQTAQGGAARRAENLRDWSLEFNYKSRSSDAPSAPDAKEPTVATPAPPPSQPPAAVDSSPRPTPTPGNAWTKGPPTSLLSTQQHATSVAPTAPSQPAQQQQQQQQSQQAKSVAPPADPSVSHATPSTAAEEQPSVSRPEPTASAAAQEENKDHSTSSEKDESGKKFSFNPNAPAFTPRMAPTTPTPSMAGMPMQMAQQAQPMMSAMPMGPVPPQSMGVQNQGMPPPMMQSMAGQQPMIVPAGQWQNPTAGQAYNQMTSYYVVNQQQLMQGQAVPMNGPRPVAATTFQPARRQPGAQTMVSMVPQGNAQQWQGQMVPMQGQMMPYTNYQYAQQGVGAAVPPPQQPYNAHMMQGGQMPQQVAQQTAYQRATYMPQMVQQPYVLPQQAQAGQPAQQQRFATPQQQQPGGPVHQGGTPGQHEPSPMYQQGGPQGSAASTGPNSQPPTPGPQPPQPVASPAQATMQQHQQQQQGRGSPLPHGAPPPQQFVQGPTHSHPSAPVAAAVSQQMMQHPGQGFYTQSMYGMYQGNPTMIMYAQPHEMQQGPQHMDGMMVAPQQQFMTQEQFAHYAPAGAQFYAQQPPPQMSRQNSIPQPVYGAQTGPNGMTMAPQQQPQQPQGPPQQQQQ